MRELHNSMLKEFLKDALRYVIKMIRQSKPSGHYDRITHHLTSLVMFFDSLARTFGPVQMSLETFDPPQKVLDIWPLPPWVMAARRAVMGSTATARLLDR